MEHNDIRHRLSEYLDNDLTPQDKAEIEAHLKTCQECEAALSELQKTVAHIKTIEEIEPPVWMKQKIMAKVRAEAEKKNLFQRLFYPLTIKLPIQAVAVLFLAVTAFYIYQSIHPTVKYGEAPMQEFATNKDASPAATPEIRKTDDSLLRSKQIPQTPEYKALDRREEYKAAPSLRPSNQVGASVPAPARPAEQLVPEKKEMLLERRAAAPQAIGKADIQEQATSSADAAPLAKAKRESIAPATGAAGSRLERAIIERYSNGKPKLIFTYEIIDSRKVKRAEEQFNPIGERHGIQKEYYTSGQLKTEAQYAQGKLEWHMEYGPDGVKKIGKSNYDWFWLKN